MSPTATLPPALRLGAVELTVADLDRSTAYYEQTLGLRTHARGDGRAELGDGETTVVALREAPGAAPAGRTAGLFHFALLYPSAAALGRAAVRLARTGTPLTGASDHGTHLALYLRDPDGHGIELATDRPREQWPAGLGYDRGPSPLDLDALTAAAGTEPPAEHVDAGLTMGHLHLHVGDIEEALTFYRDIVGFEQQAHLGTAAFVSAGGYHHHLAVNVWNGEGVGPPVPGAVVLRHWTVDVGTEPELEALRSRLAAAGAPVEDGGDGALLTRDPWGTGMRVVAGGG